MTLDRLILTNFKNYSEADIELCGNVNCFVGNNGAGKTNLLDAVYYLSFSKSYFNPVDSQNIRFGADFFAIHGHYGNDVVSCILRAAQGKQMRWNKKAYKTLAEHIGKVPLVMVSPADSQLITGGSDVRRKFVDGVISQVDNVYLEHLIQYNKAIEQRNRLLKQMWEDRQWDEGMVSVWDDQLCRHGDVVYAARARFIEEFTPHFKEYYHWIAGADEPGCIVYQRNEQPLPMQLIESRQADRYAQYTTCGPHKDDLLFLLNEECRDNEECGMRNEKCKDNEECGMRNEEFVGAPNNSSFLIPHSSLKNNSSFLTPHSSLKNNSSFSLKRFGSQGQQKSFALALKLAQFQYLLERTGQKPILLLDDIFDKLDMLRVQQLIALVGSDRFGQVLLTDTQPGRVQGIFDQLPNLEHRIFEVKNGQCYAGR